MALQKQPININFSKGIETKVDPWQLPMGKFQSLVNSVFTTTGQLRKRNGNAQLSELPDTSSNLLTTFNGNLTAVGTSFLAYNEANATWPNKGAITQCQVETLPLIRSNTNQTQVDTAIAANGLICTVFTDSVPVTGTPINFYKYAIADSATGQNIVPPTLITPTSGTVTGSARVFLLGPYFVIVFPVIISGTNGLQYIAIPTANPSSALSANAITTQYTPSSNVAFDGIVTNNSLYIAWNGNDGGGAIRATYIDSTLVQHNTKVFAGHAATLFTLAVDASASQSVIYITWYVSSGTQITTAAVTPQLNTVLAPTNVASVTTANLASYASGAVMTVLIEAVNAYGYDGSIPTNAILAATVTQAGSVSGVVTVSRSVGLASKAVMLNGAEYFLAVYQSPFQPTYFLMNSGGQVIAKLAYSNAGGYLTEGLPNILLKGQEAQIPYLIKDLVEPVNKIQGIPNPAGVYAQTGINLASFTIAVAPMISAEIGSNLNLTGGFLWSYDGYAAVEQEFFLWPDSIEATWSATGGSIAAKPDGSTNNSAYFYQVTYEWSDNQGNLFRSAPSVPFAVTTTGSASTGSVILNVPTLRLTYKTANPVKIVIYRWSVAQQTYYQVTSILNPILNDKSVDYIAYVDTSADSAIIGNNIIYTTGGVVENIGPPACSDVTLFKSRLFLIDSEDPNLLWFSKQVVESTPVEMSDLFTMYVAPTTGAQGSTSGMRCIAPMDDKLIIFKEDAIYYMTGTGPDNTGANNDFAEPVFITSTVGCANKQSIVFMPNGLMFQSDKGIWLLGRDLSTSYIGSPVEAFNSQTVLSSLNVPGTNYVLFYLSNGITLMYDYFEGEWGEFRGIAPISATLYKNKPTFIDSIGRVFQESPSVYLDGGSPVLMSFTTSWLNLAGLQGYERAYYFYLLGNYISPHKLSIQIGYDYNPAPSQGSVIAPYNFNQAYGQDSPYGSGTPYGGNPTLEQWRVHLIRQRCQAFQISLQEIYDSTLGVQAGAGLTLSGLNCVVGLKKGYYPIRGAQSVG